MRQVSDVFRILNHLSISISFIFHFCVCCYSLQPLRSVHSIPIHNSCVSLSICVGKVKAISKLFINFYSKISLKHENFAKDKFLSCCGRMNRKKNTQVKETEEKKKV